jgi:hypothetical protein
VDIDEMDAQNLPPDYKPCSDCKTKGILIDEAKRTIWQESDKRDYVASYLYEYYPQAIKGQGKEIQNKVWQAYNREINKGNKPKIKNICKEIIGWYIQDQKVS